MTVWLFILAITWVFGVAITKVLQRSLFRTTIPVSWNGVGTMTGLQIIEPMKEPDVRLVQFDRPGQTGAHFNHLTEGTAFFRRLCPKMVSDGEPSPECWITFLGRRIVTGLLWL